MTKQELEILIANYIHRDDLTSDIPGFIDLATQRIGRDLRSAENETILDPFTPLTQIADLPADFRNIKDISWITGAARIVLKASSPRAMSRFQQTGNAPAFYRVIGKQIEITPFQSKDFQLIYFNAPAALVNDLDTNAILEAYPSLYLYASLIEAYFFTQDAGGHTLATQTYTSEVDVENNRTKSADAGDRPSIQGGR